MIGAPAILLLGLLLDALFGEPDWLWSRLPHPAVLMGRAVAGLERRLNRDPYRRVAGVLALCVLVLGAGALGLGIAWLSPWGIIDAVVVAVLVAQKSLAQHVAAVAQALRLGLEDGRRAVGMIVGRDTAPLDGPGVSRAAIESGAENLSDGVVAPVFWYLLGGLPGLLIYKAVNTADSMIGYRTPRYAAFGWAAARFDDVLNWIPARLTAGLIMLAHGRWHGWAALTHDAALHRSPNAGWPEAAMARALGVALSGPRSYDGEMRDFPYVYPDGIRDPDANEIDACVRALWKSWAAMGVLVGLLALW